MQEMQETWILSLGWVIPGLGRSPGEENGNPLQLFLAWKIPWTEEPGGLQSTALQLSTPTLDEATETLEQRTEEGRAHALTAQKLQALPFH